MRESTNQAPWSYAEVWESIAEVQPDEPAFIQGHRIVRWEEFDGRADALALSLLDAGLQRDAKVATYLYNSPEYLTTTYAAFKVGMTPFNVNYRYGSEELFYLLDNADAEAVVFGAEFAPTLDVIRSQLPLVKRWIAVSSLNWPTPSWATDWEQATANPRSRAVMARWGRSGDDLLILYTGGTTGMPKGVMWRQADLWGVAAYGANPLLGQEALAHPRQAGERAATSGRPVSLVACPLMHGTGLLTAFGALSMGGAAAYLPSRQFRAEELLNEVQRLSVSRMAVVGMAFCTPMLEALDAEPERWDVSTVRLITSSGAMWSYENKQGLLRHMPQAALMDAFSSSEAIGMGLSISQAGGEAETARFMVGENCAVFADDGRRVPPGSGKRGRVAVGGHLPAGYYKDEAKTEATFPTIEGRRWSVPGDWATVNTDGTLNLLGRGSQCINTGGEKVFPEEVEEALKRHPAVRDAAVVGLPDPRFGERICALVEIKPGAEPPPVGELAQHVRTQLADYKQPRTVLYLDSVKRAPNGKLDYKTLKSTALEKIMPKVPAA